MFMLTKASANVWEQHPNTSFFQQLINPKDLDFALRQSIFEELL